MMKPQTFSDFVGPSRSSGANVCFQCCPVCGSQRWKTYVNPMNGLWWCHAAEHNAGGRVDTGLPMEGRGSHVISLMAVDPRGARERHDWPEVALPSWEPLCNRALRYLERRGVDQETATRLGMVEMKERMRIIVPYFGPAGNVIYWTARAYTDVEEGPKYLAAPSRHPLYVLPDWRGSDEVMLVEGVFDAIAVHQATGRTAVAVGGKALPRYLLGDLLYLACTSVLVLLDGDALGAAVKIKNQLQTRRKVRIVALPNGHDPSSLGQEELREALATKTVV